MIDKIVRVYIWDGDFSFNTTIWKEEGIEVYPGLFDWYDACFMLNERWASKFPIWWKRNKEILVGNHICICESGAVANMKADEFYGLGLEYIA